MRDRLSNRVCSYSGEGMWGCLLGGNAERADKRTTKSVRRKLHGFGCEREVYTKGTALAGKAVHEHPTTMCMGDMFDDGQAKAGSAKFPGPCFVHAVEPLENPIPVPRLDPNARVFDFNHGAPLFLTEPNPDAPIL